MVSLFKKCSNTGKYGQEKTLCLDTFYTEFSMRFSQQLGKAIQSANVQLCLRFTELNVMHGKSILELYSSSCRQNKIILNRFKAASITEAAESANTVLKRIKLF